LGSFLEKQKRTRKLKEPDKKRKPLKKITSYTPIKKPLSFLKGFFKRIWQLPTLPHCCAVPSAMRGLTSLFGMGRGEHPRQNHHKILIVARIWYQVAREEDFPS
jgi:hypothetical protein